MNANVREAINPQLGVREFQYALSMSDIDFIRWALDEGLWPQTLMPKIVAQLKLYEFTKSDEAYRAHYDLHEGKFYQSRDAHWFATHDWTQDARYRAIRAFAAACIGNGARRFLDFGCATGHISRTLAREFPQCEFIGTDVVPVAIDTYNRYATHNARAFLYDDIPGLPFDVIICAEVLEHVIDPYKTLDNLQWDFGNIAGFRFICTLPQGPWESQGWSGNPGAREHVRYWDFSDLLQVFGPTCSMAPSAVGMSSLGLPVYHAVTLSGARTGVVDMNAKLARYVDLARSQRGSWETVG